MEGSVSKSVLRWLLPCAAVLFIVVVSIFSYPFLSRSAPVPKELESKALDASVSIDKRVEAALRLTELGVPAQGHMRRVLAESKDSDVRAAAVQGLMHVGDWQDVPQLIKSLDDPSPWVRARAARAVWRHLGTQFDYDPNATPAARAAAIKKIQRQYKWQDDYRRFHHDAPDARRPH